MASASKRNKDPVTYLLSWDCNGLESAIEITEVEKQVEQAEKERAWKILSDPNATDPGNLGGKKLYDMVHGILLRARFNPQRNYEVYLVTCAPGITKDTLVKQFEENPQGMADLIRERGTKLYSDRATTKRVIE
jgi:hypothetical protein